ncbi:MAG: elongation factor P [Chloroflexota bacterium]|nr:elongation factor P [Chloroflexota bacterium]
MITAGDLRKGTILDLDNVLYRVMNTDYHNPGRGAASMRAQLMNIRSGATQYRVFTAEENLTNLYVEHETVQFLYRDDNFLHFMNTTTFDQYESSISLFGDDAMYLKPDMELQLMMFEGSTVLDYVLPTTVSYLVAESEMAVVGNTAGAVLKRIKTESGLSVQVPNFINEGDSIKIDTRDGSYVGRG